MRFQRILALFAIVFFAVSAKGSAAQTGFITTVAGTGTSGFNGDNILATKAQLSSPRVVALDTAGNLFIADLSNHRIRRVDVGTGLITTVAGTGTLGFNGDNILATNAQLANPIGVALDTAGNLFIADISNHRIRRVDVGTGLITTVAGTGVGAFNGDNILATKAQLANPIGVALDTAGNLFIADFSNHRIRRVDAGTGLITTVAGTGTFGFNGDNILATKAQLANPSGVALDTAGNLFIADFSNHLIRRVDAGTGLITTVAGTGTFGFNGDNILATKAQLAGPRRVALDTAGNLFIADFSNHRIRRVDAGTGLITTVAGTGVPGFNGDNILAANAQLANPIGVALDTAGNLFITDFGNHRIRRVEGFGVAPPGATPIGMSVSVTPVDETTGDSPVTITFDDVAVGGITSVTSTSTGPPPPSGFKLGAPPTYFDVSTTANWNGFANVCIDYSGITFTVPENNLKLWHFPAVGAPVNVTFGMPDTVNSIICGQVTSFSPFAVLEPIAGATFFNDLPSTTLLSSLPSPLDRTGFSVAIDGTTAVVGAPTSDVSGVQDAGAVFVFERDVPGDNGENWGLVGMLMPPTPQLTEKFGFSVGISGDTVVVGSPLRDVPGAFNGGAVYVFELDTGQATELTAPDEAGGDFFGTSVAIHGDSIVVGAPQHDGSAGVNSGKAYLFERNGGWTYSATLGEGSVAKAKFGDAVAVGAQLAAVGAPGGKPGIADVPGEVAIFDRAIPHPTSGWARVARLSGDPLDPGGIFGLSVAVSGASVIVGAPSEYELRGRAYVFLRRSFGTFAKTKLFPTNSSPNRRFGHAVSIAGGGCASMAGECTAVVTGGVFDHAAYVFDRVWDTIWGVDHGPNGSADETEQLISPRADIDPASDFGQSVAMSGSTAIVGATFHDLDNPADGAGFVVNRGAAFIFSEEAIIAPETDVRTDPENIGDGVVIEDGAFVGIGAVIGDGALIKTGARIEEGATVKAFTTVGADARVGEGATVGPNVVLADRSRVGDRSTVGAGSEIGFSTFLGNDVTVGADAQVGVFVRIFAGSVLGDDVSIGDNTDVRANGSIGDGVSIGVDGDVGARTRILDGSLIGDDVTIHAGAFLGFRVTVGNDTEIRRATIENDVFIGPRVFVGNNVTIFAGSVVPADANIPNGCTAMPIGC